MNNEPVAWRNLCVSNIDEDSEWIYNEIGQGEPLYTHPVKELDEQFEKGFKAGKEEGWKAHKFHHPAKTLTDKELIIFLMDEIDRASQWLVEGQTHMATGVLGQCHAEIRKHLSR